MSQGGRGKFMKFSMLYPVNTVTRRVISLNGMWKFKLDPKSEGIKKGWINGLPNADLIPMPSSFADLYTDKDIREYCGDFWYETNMFVPQEWKGMDVNIRFGCATHIATVFVNGQKITHHIGGFLPFCARVTDAITYGASNRISVVINNELSETNIPCGKTTILPSGKKVATPYFDFYNYSGLQRPVWLVATPKEAVQDFSVATRLNGSEAVVDYAVITSGVHGVTVTVQNAAGKTVAVSTGKTGKLRVEDAHLWQVRNAYLYTFTIRIMDGKTVLDEYTQPIGLRTVEISGTDILVNGRAIYLKGFGKHEDSDIVGRGYNPAVIKRDFELMKWIGANSFRTSHYPCSEEIYQMADREGFLVIDEVPAVGMFETTMSAADASSGKKTAFFSKKTTPQLLQNHLNALEEMIARDKNYACVIAWSLFNEPESTDPNARPYFESVFAKARELDPQKRPRTFAMIMNSRPDTCKCYQYSDFLCLNRYYGWYVFGGNQVEMGEYAMRKELDGWAAKGLNKPFVFTEYGADTYAGEHKLPSVMWSEEYQIEYLKMCHAVFDRYDFIKGELVWNFADFQTTEGILRVDGNKKGIFTRQRQPKRAAFYLKERWESLPSNFKCGNPSFTDNRVN